MLFCQQTEAWQNRNVAGVSKRRQRFRYTTMPPILNFYSVLSIGHNLSSSWATHRKLGQTKTSDILEISDVLTQVLYVAPNFWPMLFCQQTEAWQNRNVAGVQNAGNFVFGVVLCCVARLLHCNAAPRLMGEVFLLNPSFLCGTQLEN